MPNLYRPSSGSLHHFDTSNVNGLAAAGRTDTAGGLVSAQPYRSASGADVLRRLSRRASRRDSSHETGAVTGDQDFASSRQSSATQDVVVRTTRHFSWRRPSIPHGTDVGSQTLHPPFSAAPQAPSRQPSFANLRRRLSSRRSLRSVAGTTPVTSAASLRPSLQSNAEIREPRRLRLVQALRQRSLRRARDARAAAVSAQTLNRDAADLQSPRGGVPRALAEQSGPPTNSVSLLSRRQRSIRALRQRTWGRSDRPRQPVRHVPSNAGEGEQLQHVGRQGSFATLRRRLSRSWSMEALAGRSAKTRPQQTVAAESSRASDDTANFLRRTASRRMRRRSPPDGPPVLSSERDGIGSQPETAAQTLTKRQRRRTERTVARQGRRAEKVRMRQIKEAARNERRGLERLKTSKSPGPGVQNAETEDSKSCTQRTAILPRPEISANPPSPPTRYKTLPVSSMTQSCEAGPSNPRRRLRSSSKDSTGLFQQRIRDSLDPLSHLNRVDTASTNNTDIRYSGELFAREKELQAANSA